MTCDRRMDLMDVSQISPLYLPLFVPDKIHQGKKDGNPSPKPLEWDYKELFVWKNSLWFLLHISFFSSRPPTTLCSFVSFAMYSLWILIPLSDLVWSASLCFYANLSVLHSQVWRLEIKLKSCAFPDLFTDYFVVQIPLVWGPWKIPINIAITPRISKRCCMKYFARPMLCRWVVGGGCY